MPSEEAPNSRESPGRGAGKEGTWVGWEPLEAGAQVCLISTEDEGSGPGCCHRT